MSEKLQLTLITGRSIDQGAGKEYGKGSQQYYNTAAICYLDPVDLKKLEISHKSHVKVTAKFGSVVVRAQKYPFGNNPGLIFMPCGLWANAVCGDTTYSRDTVPIMLRKVVEPPPDVPCDEAILNAILAEVRQIKADREDKPVKQTKKKK